MNRNLLVFGALCTAIAGLSGRAFANVAPLPADPVAPFNITADSRTTENRLVIPRKFLEGAGVAAAYREDAADTASLRTVLAGLAISLAAVSLAYLLVRKKRPVAQGVAVLLATGGFGFLIVEYVAADVAPPIAEIPSSWRHVAESQRNVTIEITDEGDAVVLIVGTYRRRSRPEPEPLKPPNTSSDGSAAPPPADAPN